MANDMKYFIGNWKMFGVPKSVNILKKINNFVKMDKNSKKYQTIITPPFTLLETFTKNFKNTKIEIGAQNCFHKDYFSSDTGAISSYMIYKLGSKYSIIGHSDNRAEGDTDLMLKNKVKYALKNKLKVIFCIGENKIQKNKKQTFKVLKSQITKVLEGKFDRKKIIIAYEPIWSIGTGKIPNSYDLMITAKFIKKVLNQVFKNKKTPPLLYGGSVDGSNVAQFNKLEEIDGFLIGGASKSSKKFIDIIKNYYR
jgi:triosephosphate isomerase|tara:strand:+ start:408 stop:1166 length:759 start_codon:yes stop_codon:yes gene_type:complete